MPPATITSVPLTHIMSIHMGCSTFVSPGGPKGEHAASTQSGLSLLWRRRVGRAAPCGLYRLAMAFLAAAFALSIHLWREKKSRWNLDREWLVAVASRGQLFLQSFVLKRLARFVLSTPGQGTFLFSHFCLFVMVIERGCYRAQANTSANQNDCWHRRSHH